MTPPFLPCVQVRHPLGSARSRRRRLRDTVVTISCGSLALLIVAGYVIGPRVMHVYAESETDFARATVKKYVYEAFPSWAFVHPDRTCPERLAELNEWMNNKDIKDPWGGDYRHVCLPGKPSLVVWSAGEDRIPGTADDIWSDR